jgi:hypothetical protein
MTQPVIFKGIQHTEKEDKCNPENTGKNKPHKTRR